LNAALDPSQPFVSIQRRELPEHHEDRDSVLTAYRLGRYNPAGVEMSSMIRIDAMHARYPHLWMTLVLAVWWMSLPGCQLHPAPGLVSCPLPSTEQVAAVLEVVPVGTPRSEVEEKLVPAGFAGSFGANNTLYYCDIWDRGEGLRWHVNVILLFDEEGRLYATRPDLQGGLNPTPRDTAAQVLQTSEPTEPDPYR
jgi:hypothetical protein